MLQDIREIKIDITKDIFLLKQYIKEFDLATINLIKEKEINDDKNFESYNFYFGQLELIAKIHPNFDFEQFLTTEENKVFSYFFSTTFKSLQKEYFKKCEDKIKHYSKLY